VLTYLAITSLDGYINDASGDFSWSMPDEAVHAFVNDLARPIGTYVYGRRLYEVMRAWETMPLDGEPDVMVDYADLWRAADKVVVSSTLASVETQRTRLVSSLDEALVGLTGSASVGGAVLAGEAFRRGLVTDVHLLMSPVIVGGGTRALPDDVRMDLELVASRSFDNGVLYGGYRVLHRT
jgi:dihydrofolate reductase